MNGVSLYIEPEPDKNPFLVFGKPDIGHGEIEMAARVLRSGWLSTGQVVKDFEKEFEAHIGNAGYAVAVSSCTDGMILSLLASGISQGDEVVTTPLTFAATVNAILAVGAYPVFVDVDKRGQIDVDQIRTILEETLPPYRRIKAILPVHYTGSSPDMDEILNLARENDLKVIEDAAHGFGGHYIRRYGSDEAHGKVHVKKQPLGTMGDFGCFSFYATKNITCGEGGMVVAKTAEMAERVRTMAMQGLTAGAYRRYGSGPIQRYEVSVPGRKCNLSDIHAGIGLIQLRRWDDELKPRRAAVWSVYEKAFGRKPAGHSHHLYTIQHPNRDELRVFLHGKGIGTGVHFNPLHLEPAYRFLGLKKGDFPMAERIGSETLSLPVSSAMTVEDAYRVVDAVNEYAEGK